MDQVTLPRAVAQQALEALEELNGWQSLAPPLASQAGRQAAINLRAALEQPARPLCKGIPRRGCNYLAPCDTVCNKCGEIHHHHQMVAHFEAAQQPEQEPVAWRYDQATYMPGDVRGRQWKFNVFAQHKPYMNNMVQNVTPLYTPPTTTTQPEPK
jgi:hypothetical protein